MFIFSLKRVATVLLCLSTSNSVLQQLREAKVIYLWHRRVAAAAEEAGEHVAICCHSSPCGVVPVLPCPRHPSLLVPSMLRILLFVCLFFREEGFSTTTAQAQQMLSCWSWGCCLCWVCCWNPLGSCLPLTTSETLEKARSADPEPQQEMKEMKEPLIVEETYLSRELAQTEADPPSPLHGLLEKSKNDVVNREREQMHLFKLMIDKYASKSEDRSDRPGTTMLWLAKWTVQQPGAKSGWGKKFHTAMAELLPILYAFLWSLVVARICLEHQDGFIQMPISNSFGDFAPILELCVIVGNILHVKEYLKPIRTVQISTFNTIPTMN